MVGYSVIARLFLFLLVPMLVIASCTRPAPTPTQPVTTPPPIPTAPVEAVYLTSIGGGPGKGQFNGPRAIAMDRTGKVYVADTNYQRVQVFDANGVFIRLWGTYGTAPGQFNNPSGIAVDNAGNVYIADSVNDRIQVFTGDGRCLPTWYRAKKHPFLWPHRGNIRKDTPLATIHAWIRSPFTKGLPCYLSEVKCEPHSSSMGTLSPVEGKRSPG